MVEKANRIFSPSLGQFATLISGRATRDGSNISPQEVEEAIYDHPAVLEAAVVGMPDPLHGERVVAFEALREGLVVAGEQEVIDHTPQRLADYKVPETILFLSELPKGITGKIQRRALKQEGSGNVRR